MPRKQSRRDSAKPNQGQNMKKEFKRPVLQAKTENQKDLIRSIYDNEIIICTGPSGTGKSMIACAIASKMLLEGEIEQIIATRPIISAGKDFGLLPGDVLAKVMPYLRLCEEYFKMFMGNDTCQRMIDTGRIKYEPLELMRGATFNNSFMILDEAQNCTKEQIKMFITRMGFDSKVVINGDVKQSDVKVSGLEHVKRKLSNIEGISINELDISDIQRNGILGKVLQALDE